MSTPEPWWKSAVFYQIYPRSFADASGDGVGDLQGIVQKLDHLNGSEQSLGIDALWISPFYRSPMADMGYDVSDYIDVDPLFGSLQDFDTLLAEARARGIRVVVDLVPNHTSDQHPWFVESRSSRANPKRDWYVWRDGAPNGGPPNNWLSFFSQVGSAWTRDEASGQWYLHSFMPQQPDLNWDNPEVEAAIHEVARFWLDRGIDGFRLDVPMVIGKDPEYRDNPEPLVHPPFGPYNVDFPSVHEKWQRFRALVDTYDDRVVVGEIHLPERSALLRYVINGDEFHMVHDFDLAHAKWSAMDFAAIIDEVMAESSSHFWPTWLLEDHDYPRVATKFGADHGAERARAAAVLLATLRGTPFIYQGQELGLPDAAIPPEKANDVDGRDPQRAPIPWEPPSKAGVGAGFTTGEPWLPVVVNAEHLNVASQQADPASTLHFFRELLRLRRATPALQVGEFRWLIRTADFFSYERSLGDERLVIALNFSDSPQMLDIQGQRLISSLRSNASELKPFEAVIIRSV